MPDSWVDRILRRIYHFFPSQPFNTARKIKASFDSYHRWLVQNDERIASIPDNSANGARVTFLLPLDSDNIEQALDTIISIRSQSVPDWELIISLSIEIQKPGWLVEEAGKEPRIKIIPYHRANLKNMLASSTGDYLVCCWPGDQYSKAFFPIFLQYLQSTQESVVFYPDCDERFSISSHPLPFFKPGIHSPELLLSKNYLSRSFINKKIALQYLSENDEEYEFLVQEWELLLRLSFDHHKMTHIPVTLIHQVETQPENQDQVNKMISSIMTRQGHSGVQVNRKGPFIDIKWDFLPPLVSIIIPTKNNYRVLRTFLDSLYEITDYPSYEVILVDNQSDSPKILAYYESLRQMNQVRILPYPEKFNYSRANNLGALHANGSLLLFINNDMQVIHKDWLSELVQWALIPEIAVVGAKLLFPNHMIQHAGVVLGMHGIAGHIYQNAPHDFRGLLGSVNWYRNFSAVTGACQLMRKEIFSELGGFDETYHLTFSDIDLCLRAVKLSYRILYNPNAILVHHQGKTRGVYNPENDIVMGYNKLKDWLNENDPYFSPNLTYSVIPFCKFN